MILTSSSLRMGRERTCMEGEERRGGRRGEEGEKYDNIAGRRARN